MPPEKGEQPSEGRGDAAELPVCPTARELRKAWEPRKEQLSDVGYERDTAIRFHRACSWLEQAEKLDPKEDQRLVMLWIAFNALYGVWDTEEQVSQPDVKSWKCFLGDILALDQKQVLSRLLLQHRPLVMRLLEDEYLSKYFWQEPTRKRAGQSRKAMHKAKNWYHQKLWLPILEGVLERVYLLRCQLVHGAATYDSKLNRVALKRCSIMLGHLQPALMSVFVDYGAKTDWGAMCYPPLNQDHKLR